MDTKTGVLDKQRLLDVTITFLSYQYLSRLDEKYSLISLTLKLAPSDRRQLRSILLNEIVFEGIALFRSSRIPTEKELLLILEDSFKGDAEDGPKRQFLSMLKGTGDPVLISASSVSIEVLDKSRANEIGTVRVKPSQDSMLSEIPVMASAVSSILFLIFVIFIARRSSRVQKYFSDDMIGESIGEEVHNMVEEYPELSMSNRTEPISGDEEDLDGCDSAFSSQSYTFSMPYDHITNSVVDRDSFSGAGSSLTGMTMNDNRLNAILQGNSNREGQREESPWDTFQSSGDSLRLLEDQVHDDVSDLASDMEASISTITRSVY